MVTVERPPDVETFLAAAYTDLANPTANRIYEAIGHEPVDRSAGPSTGSSPILEP